MSNQQEEPDNFNCIRVLDEHGTPASGQSEVH